MDKISKLPQHVVAIPDGNRRWARQRKLSPWRGHQAGAKNLEKVLATVRDMDLPCFSFWGMSKDNITKRPKIEVKFLLEIFKAASAKLIKQPDIYDHKVRVNILGSWPELFPARVKKPMQDLIEATKHHDQKYLNFLICYDGKDEMLQAINKIAKQARNNKSLKITPSLVKSNLWTKDLPPVDLVIRTGVENDPHWSGGFMMWDCADAQLHFSDKTWPDYGPDEFTKAVESFGKRERRFGQ